MEDSGSLSPTEPRYYTCAVYLIGNAHIGVHVQDISDRAGSYAEAKKRPNNLLDTILRRAERESKTAYHSVDEIQMGMLAC